MKRNFTTRNSLIHLYNPKEEGLGLYDLNYMNAYRKDKRIKNNQNNKDNERYAA